MDMVIRYVDKYGYLPIIKVDGRETYRGEFQKTPEDALGRILNRLVEVSSDDS